MPTLFFPPADSPEFKEAMAANQAIAERTAYTVDEALEPINAVGQVARPRDLARWQAHYDLIRGRLLAMKVRCYEYNWACARMKKDPPKFKNPKANAWRLVPDTPIQYSDKAAAAAREAESLLQRVDRRAPGDPLGPARPARAQGPVRLQVGRDLRASPRRERQQRRGRGRKNRRHARGEAAGTPEALAPRLSTEDARVEPGITPTPRSSGRRSDDVAQFDTSRFEVECRTILRPRRGPRDMDLHFLLASSDDEHRGTSGWRPGRRCRPVGHRCYRARRPAPIRPGGLRPSTASPGRRPAPAVDRRRRSAADRRRRAVDGSPTGDADCPGPGQPEPSAHMARRGRCTPPRRRLHGPDRQAAPEGAEAAGRSRRQPGPAAAPAAGLERLAAGPRRDPLGPGRGDLLRQDSGQEGRQLRLGAGRLPPGRARGAPHLGRPRQHPPRPGRRRASTAAPAPAVEMAGDGGGEDGDGGGGGRRGRVRPRGPLGHAPVPGRRQARDQRGRQPAGFKIEGLGGSPMSTLPAAPAADLGGGGMIAGDPVFDVKEIGVALDQLAREILRHLKDHKLTVVWLFDESVSMKDDQKAIREKFDRVSTELKVNIDPDKKSAGALNHAIVGFGQGIDFVLEKPTLDIDEIGRAIEQAAGPT